jgi:hypothetical protein
MSPRPAVPTRTRDDGEPAVDKLVDFLRRAHKADREQFMHFAHAVDDLPRVPATEPSAAAAMIASQARALVKQLPHVHVSAMPALRCALLMLSDALAMERGADAEANPRKYQPFYNRD